MEKSQITSEGILFFDSQMVQMEAIYST